MIVCKTVCNATNKQVAVIARILMDAWSELQVPPGLENRSVAEGEAFGIRVKAEGAHPAVSATGTVNASYVATFADMARAVLDDPEARACWPAETSGTRTGSTASSVARSPRSTTASRTSSGEPLSG